MELSELTNRELKNILRENQVKNYSKLNKKELVKKVNQLIKEQNGGKSDKKKYTLKELVGGLESNEISKSLLSNENMAKKNEDPNIYSRESRGYQPPSRVNIPIIKNEKNRAKTQQLQQPSAILLNNSENNKQGQQIAQLLNNNSRTIQNNGTLVNPQTNSIQSNPDNPQNECNSCTIQ